MEIWSRMRDRSASALLASALFVLSFSAAQVQAQEGQQSPEPSCIAKDEPIYTPGEDHVKFPEVQMASHHPDNPNAIKPGTRASFDLLINSSGQICTVKALRAPNREEAIELANFVADNFRFKPATRKGKPVAVRFVTIFNIKLDK
jgi:hypothetical protein